MVLGPWDSFGVQVNTPLAAFKFTPVGADTSAKVSVCAGISLSLAVLVTVNVLNSLIVCCPGTVSVGALFTSLTITVKVCVALMLGDPLSVTRKVI